MEEWAASSILTATLVLVAKTTKFQAISRVIVLTLFTVYESISFQAMGTLSFLVLLANMLIFSSFFKFFLKFGLKFFVWGRIGLISLLNFSFSNTLITRRLMSRGGGSLTFQLFLDPGQCRIRFGEAVMSCLRLPRFDRVM